MHSPARRSALKLTAAAGLGLLTAGCKPPAPAPAARAESPFAEGALRFDFRHLTRAEGDTFELERLRAEPRWGGRNDASTPSPDWGDYRLVLLDRESVPLYRAGFESPAATGARPATATLSLRSPMPRSALRAAVEKRRAGGHWQALWTAALDPAAAALDRSPPALATRAEALLANGASDAKADLAILGDGYTNDEHPKFIADARRAMGYLFSADPFSGRAKDFNVYAVFTPSPESGVEDRFLGVRKRTAFSATYYAGEAERTLATRDTVSLHEAASAVPWDFMLVLANSRRYGGSAHYGGPAVVAIDSAAAKYLVLHELAHTIAGLAEEYYVPDGRGPVYRGNIEPWHPNVTLGAGAAKWADAERSAPAPRDWNKAEYDRRFARYVERYRALRSARAGEAAVEALMREERAAQAALLRDRTARRVGLYEGAHGYARGVYRSEVDCIMFSLQNEYFCGACAAALERGISDRAR